MTKILFVCHGNICRSPMAHCVFTHMVNTAGLASDFYIASAATHTDELGSDIYPPAKRKMHDMGIPMHHHRATLLEKSDYDKYDMLIGMDAANIRNMHRICGGDPEGKIFRLLDLTDHPRDVADPWYTGDFDATFRDVTQGCTRLMEKLGLA